MNGRANPAGGDRQHEDQGGPRRSSESELPQARRPAASPGDYLANERTLLAWLRTGVALIGLGFVVARFGLFLREFGLRGGAPGQGAVGEHWSTLIGTIIILLAALLLSLSYLRYRGAAQAMEQGAYYHRRGLSLVAASGVVVIALVLAAYLLLTS